MSVEEKKKYTEADYQLLEEGAPYQLIDGELVMSPSPVPFHQILLGRLFKIVDNFLEQKNLGGLCIFAPMDVRLDEENIFQPDLLYISEERRSELVQARISGAPDLIVEILSPSTAHYDLQQKKIFYERYGVKEYLIIDPLSKNAEVYVLNDKQFVLQQKGHQNGTITLNTLPGLQISLQHLFA